MIPTETLDLLRANGLSTWADVLPQQTQSRLDPAHWGHLPDWQRAVEALPAAQISGVHLSTPPVTIEGETEDPRALKKQLEALKPWRKGPYRFFDVAVDAEWRSDLKWDRIKEHVEPLKETVCLDIGCGNGYHCWRMRGAGAKLAVGIDPTVLFVLQFQAVQRYIQDPGVTVLPLGIDDLPGDFEYFDRVFSMGLLYHLRQPRAHVFHLKRCLKPGGRLVLETLIIDGLRGETLSPEGRYAKMKNVFVIPSVPTVEDWLQEAGFEQIRCVDSTKITSAEQRVTSWSAQQSLADFLDPHNSQRTIEGYPAPQRAVFLAERP